MTTATAEAATIKPDRNERTRREDHPAASLGKNAKTIAILTLVLGIVAGLFAPLVLAQEVAGEPADAITTQSSRTDDQKIERRVAGIFAELSTLNEVTVSVSAGVLELRGSVANEEQAARAIRIAERVDGVVTVTDNLERTLDVTSNLKPLLGDLNDTMATWLRATPLFLAALVLALIVAYAGHRLAQWQGLWTRLTPNPFLADLLAHAVRVAALIAALVVGLTLIGANAMVGTVLGGAGVIGLAIGFAIRDTLENYISSIMLSIRQPFRATEHVQINDHEGIVVRLTSRATVLMTLDGNHLRIPNADVYKAVILNYTRNPERRFTFELGIDADDDPADAMTRGCDVVRSLPFVIPTPEPTAIIRNVGDSNIVIEYHGWIDQLETDWAKARSLAISAVKDMLEAQGFTLPEPIYRLRFDGQSPVSQVLREDRAEHSESQTTNRPGIDTDNRQGDGAVTPEPQQIDVSPDRHLDAKVRAERVSDGVEDLLSENAPAE